jgi:hypothetical protein
MIDAIETRFAELLAEGQKLVGGIRVQAEGDYEYWVDSVKIVDYHGWLVSSANLIKTVAPANSHLRVETGKLLGETGSATGIMTTTVTKMLGLLRSAAAEWKAGLLRKIEHMVAAATFDDFLDQAVGYHKGGMKVEAAVLASAVFEDAIKRIADKNGILTKDRTADPLIDELVVNCVFNAIKAKRAKVYAGVRNKALHAAWDDFDLKDVGSLITGVGEIVEQYL